MNEPTQEQTGTVVAIESVDQLGHAIVTWHYNAMMQLHHMLDVPTGTSATVNFDEKEDKPEDIILEDDMLKGFKAGIITALGIFDSLPFRAQVAEEVPANDSPATPE